MTTISSWYRNNRRMIISYSLTAIFVAVFFYSPIWNGGHSELASGTGSTVSGSGSIYYNPPYVWTDVRLASMSNNFHLSATLTQSLSTGDIIDITFPAGFDISGASKLDSYGTIFWDNRDINGYSDQTVTISSLSTDDESNTVSLTLAVDGDGTIGDSGDYLLFVLGNITNSSTPSTNHVLQFTTKTAESQVIEGPYSFNAIEVTAAGAGSVTINVVDADTQVGIPNVSVQVYSWAFGTQTTMTSGTGSAVMTGIPVDGIWGTYVSVWMDGSKSINGYMPNWSSTSLYLTSGSPSQTATISLSPADLLISGTISHPGIGTNGSTKVSVWASGNEWTNKTITLDADGSTSYTLQLANPGYYSLGINKYWDSYGGYATDANFVTPSSQTVSVGADNNSGNPLTKNFALSLADKTITITVTDQNGAPMTNGWCNLWSDYTSGSSYWANSQTNTSGICSLAAGAGTYNISVYIPGIYSNNNQQVTVDANDTNIPISFVLALPDNTLSGTVRDSGGNGIQYSSVNCWKPNGNGWGYGMTDASGNFSFLVTDGTWTCNAWAPTIGEVPAATGVDTTNFTVSGDLPNINFAYDPNAFATITGTVQRSDSTAITYSWLSFERYDSVTKQYVAWGNGASTDANGSFSVQVIKNSGTDRYRASMWESSLGQFSLTNDIDVSAGSISLGTIQLPALQEVTINVTEVPTTTSTLWISILNEDNGYWNSTSVNLTSGSGSSIMNLVDGNYSAHIWLPGLGEYSDSFTISGASDSVSFDFSDITVATITTTVVDEIGSPVSGAYVSISDTVNDTFVNGFTDSTGQASLTVMQDSDSSFVVMSNKSGFISSSTTLTSGESTASITLQTADGTISGTALDADGNPVANALVEATNADGGWISTRTDGSGNYSLEVADDDYDISIRTSNGEYGTSDTVAQGDTSAEVVVDQSLSYFINEDPAVANIDPTSEVSVTTDLASITASANAISEDSNGLTFTVDDTTSSPEINGVGAPGAVAVSIEVTDSSGGSVTSLNDDITLEINYTDEQINALVDADQISISDMDVCLGYYDEINGAWVCLDGSTVSITYQDDSGDEYVTEDLTDWLSTNSSNPETTFDNYNDATIDYVATTNHFTVFAPVIRSSSSSSSTVTGRRTVEGGGSGGSGGGSSGTAGTSANTTQTSVPLATIPASEAAETPSAKQIVINIKSDYKDHWANTYIQTLFDRGLVKGCGTDKFCPDDNITRAELLKIAMSVFNIPTDTATLSFPDVSTDHWAKTYIAGAKKANIIQGYLDGTFRPDDKINRAEALKILFAASGISLLTADQASGTFTDVSKTDWYYKYVQKAYKSNIVKGYKDGIREIFKPAQPVTRAEFVKMAIQTEALNKK